MKSFVISLSTEFKRREHITTEFKRQNVDFSFFDAVTPETIEVATKELGLDLSATELRKSEISCLLSHIVLWKKAIDENIPYIAIFEDDIYLGKHANKFLMHDEWLNSGSLDIVKLEVFYDEIGVKKEILPIFVNGRKLFELSQRHMGCGGYILSQAAAKRLIEFVKSYKKLIPIDHIVFHDYLMMENVQIHQLVPALCIQDHKLRKTHTHFPSALEKDRNRRKGEKLYKPKLNILQKAQREILRVIKNMLEIIKKIRQQQHADILIIKLRFK